LTTARELGAEGAGDRPITSASRPRPGGRPRALSRPARKSATRSYFLFATTREQPRGVALSAWRTGPKAQTRELARRFGLSVAGQGTTARDICFVPSGPLHRCDRAAQARRGRNRATSSIWMAASFGRHSGIIHFTVGPTPGGLASPPGHPLYGRSPRCIIAPRGRGNPGARRCAPSRMRLREVNWLGRGTASRHALCVGWHEVFRQGALHAAARSRPWLSRGRPHGVEVDLLDGRRTACPPGQACVFLRRSRGTGAGARRRLHPKRGSRQPRLPAMREARVALGCMIPGDAVHVRPCAGHPPLVCLTAKAWMAENSRRSVSWRGGRWRAKSTSTRLQRLYARWAPVYDPSCSARSLMPAARPTIAAAERIGRAHPRRRHRHRHIAHRLRADTADRRRRLLRADAAQGRTRRPRSRHGALAHVQALGGDGRTAFGLPPTPSSTRLVAQYVITHRARPGGPALGGVCPRHQTGRRNHPGQPSRRRGGDPRRVPSSRALPRWHGGSAGGRNSAGSDWRNGPSATAGVRLLERRPMPPARGIFSLIRFGAASGEWRRGEGGRTAGDMQIAGVNEPGELPILGWPHLRTCAARARLNALDGSVETLSDRARRSIPAPPALRPSARQLWRRPKSGRLCA